MRAVAGRLASLLTGLLVATSGCATDEPQREKVTALPWSEAVVSVTDLDRTAEFFTGIGDYVVRWRGPLDATEIRAFGLPATASGEATLLEHDGHATGRVRLVRFDSAGRRDPMRPGARSWDTGCYTSLMVRMKSIRDIYDNAIALGWWTETPIVQLTFGTSILDVVIFRGPDGLQVQGYERLQPALPEAVGEFAVMTRPFNMMQMVRDRDAAYAFYTEVLGFETFYLGKPYVADEPTYSPLGVPVNLSTTHRYQAAIVYPQPGEFGRMEMIEFMDIDGRDHSTRCVAPNLGILAVRFPVADAGQAEALVRARGWPVDRASAESLVQPYGRIRSFGVRTPDGALIEFFER